MKMALTKFIVILIVVFVYCIQSCLSLDNGLALSPPMGWLTWERFRCNVDCINDPENCISEKLIMQMADRMANDGYLKAGYEYIMIDDCWLSNTRDSNGRLQPDPQRFPSGIPALVDYVHSKGLKFGIYEDYGTNTCAGYPGSIDHMELDAQTFAEWNVDYLKFDGCNSDPKTMDYGYPLMYTYLNQTKRPIVYSCEWPLYQLVSGIQPNYTSISTYCNLWRNYGDITDDWDSIMDIYNWYAKNQDMLRAYQGPGAWNDPDELVIGNFGLSYGQSQAQMAIWSIWAAPLLMSVDLRDIPDWAKDILLNEQLIAINQDKLGIMGKRILQTNGVDIWTKPLSNDYTAFVFFCPDPYGTKIKVKVSLNELGLIRYQAYHLFETFSGKLIGTYNYNDNFNCTVNSAGGVFAFWAQPAETKSGHLVDPLPLVNLRVLLDKVF